MPRGELLHPPQDVLRGDHVRNLGYKYNIRIEGIEMVVGHLSNGLLSKSNIISAIFAIEMVII